MSSRRVALGFAVATLAVAGASASPSFAGETSRPDRSPDVRLTCELKGRCVTVETGSCPRGWDASDGIYKLMFWYREGKVVIGQTGEEYELPITCSSER